RPVIVKPFHIQSISPEFNVASFVSQAIGCATNSQPCRSQTSCASSRSNPVYSPSSPTNPIGGKFWSNPTVNVSPSCFSSNVAVSSDALPLSSELPALSSWPPHPAISAVDAIIRARIIASLFFISFSSSSFHAENSQDFKHYFAINCL